MNDLKLAKKICKYGFDYKMNRIFIIIFFLLGLLYMSFGGNGSEVLGATFIMLAPMYILQILVSVNYTSMALTSGKRKRMQLDMWCKLNSVGIYISYTLSVAAYVLINRIRGNFNMDNLKANIINFSIMAVMLTIYAAIAYKAFIFGMIVFMVIFLLFLNTHYRIHVFTGYPLVIYIIAAFVIISVGNIIYYLITKVTYKMPYSRLALGARLRSKL